MSLEIVKVDLHATRDGVRALIYPKDCARALISLGGQFPDDRIKEQKLDEATRRALNGDRSGYFKASFVGGKWKPSRRLPDQGW